MRQRLRWFWWIGGQKEKSASAALILGLILNCSGEPEGIRTLDLLIKSQLVCTDAQRTREDNNRHDATKGLDLTCVNSDTYCHSRRE